ncbi:unnamed protein product, partial [Didymodactylos carnosus]
MKALRQCFSRLALCCRRRKSKAKDTPKKEDEDQESSKDRETGSIQPKRQSLPAASYDTVGELTRSTSITKTPITLSKVLLRRTVHRLESQ